ncbi:hypothetical protein, partial [Streptomyces phaeochromogenes]|uniref:hypothetical protein n=1 Tax=Streptomyces phaeochromogenes TaxID=1923 RepID=UPI00197FC099
CREGRGHRDPDDSGGGGGGGGQGRQGLELDLGFSLGLGRSCDLPLFLRPRCAFFSPRCPCRCFWLGL